MKPRIIASISAGILATSLLPGCSTSPPVRFYMIEPIASAEPEQSAHPPSIAIGSIEIAEHLNRSEIVIRGEAYQVDVFEYDRWAEPLEDNIAAVLAENLSRLIPTDNVRALSDGMDGIDYTVKIQIIRLGSQSAETEAMLKAVWIIENARGEIIQQNRNLYSYPLRNSEMVSLVEGLSQTMEQLSQEIATSLRKANANKETTTSRNKKIPEA